MSLTIVPMRCVNRILKSFSRNLSSTSNVNAGSKNDAAIEGGLSGSESTQVPAESQQSGTNNLGSKVGGEELSGFGRAFVSQSKLISPQPAEEVNLSFPTMLRNSKLMQLGDPKGKVVEGKITHIVGEDLYIDFGGKFQCVCQRPQKNARDYVRGSRVKLRLEALELSTKFLGASKDLTLREADGLLMGVLRSKARKSSAV